MHLSQIYSRISAIPTRNLEIEKIRDQLSFAARHQGAMVNALKQFLQTGDQKFIHGTDGYVASVKAYENDFAELARLRDAYFTTHELKSLEK